MALPQITEAFDTLYSTTWKLMRKKAIDNVFGATPFWYYLRKSESIKRKTGGRKIGIQLEYGTHSNAIKWITANHDLSAEVTAAKNAEFITTAEFDWAYVTGTVYRKWVDDQQNQGESKMIDIVQSKLGNVKKSLTEDLEQHAFSNYVAGELHGLQYLVQDDPTAVGTVGGIDQVAETWWRNKADNMIDIDETLYLVPHMRTMFNNTSKGVETPDLIVTDQETFELYEDEVMELKQIVNSTEGDASFETLHFKGKPIIWSPSSPSNKMYFLSLNYLELIIDPGVDFLMTNWKEGKSDLDRVAQILMAGNMVTSNRSRQGVIYNIGQTSGV